MLLFPDKLASLAIAGINLYPFKTFNITSLLEKKIQIDTTKLRVAFSTLGCRLNQAETEAAMEQFVSRGWTVVDFDKPADVYYINTCTVTGSADRSSRQLLHRARRKNEDAVVVAAGCFAKRAALELADSSEVDLVLGTIEKMHPFDHHDYLERPAKPIVKVFGDGDKKVHPAVGTRISGRTRAHLKVQDGCDHSCAYCAVTLARGKSRSASWGDILIALKRVKSLGYQEVVFTGVDLTAWGRDKPSGSKDFVDLVSLATDIGIPRVRLSSVEPWEITPERIERLLQHDTWCPHLHLSLQSANPKVLQTMNRLSDLGRLRESISTLLSAVPDATLGADIIVGFPGEDEDAFQDSLRFLHESPLHYLHVFPFSPRPGTVASQLPTDLDKNTIGKRAKLLRRAGQKQKRMHLSSMVGGIQEVLIEEGGEKGYTRNYLRVHLVNGEGKPQTRIQVKILELESNNDILAAEEMP
ncbi:tRNA (N(6)-L-threonylcarbamoyladenosine(37)-C(2))-methylthiotransferase MtaB [bacterium]|nr:tRNA (N(6)-L-threonylcarbamoyladenosine(37)-C(2))-methylthiotransferase MtaB [bacterium]